MNRRWLLSLLGLAACSGGNDDMFSRRPGERFNRGRVPTVAPAAPDYPETLPGVVMWLDARQPKFTDLAGATPAGYSAPVRRLNLRVPAGQYASAASDAERPLEENGTLNFHVAHAMSAPVASSVTQNNCTFAMSFALRDSWYGSILRNIATALSYAFQAGIVNGRYVAIDYVYDAVGPSLMGVPPTYHQVYPCEPAAVVVRVSPTEVKVSAVVRGSRYDVTFTHSNPATALSGPWLIAGLETPAAIKHGIVVSRAISDGENDALLAWLVANPAPTYFPTDLDVVLVHGDSIARSLTVVSRLDWWTIRMQESLCATRNINMFSGAQSGDTISMQLPVYTNITKPFYSAARSKNIILNAVAINNMRTGGQSAATAWGEYSSFLDTQLADGFLPIACTVLPTTTVAAATTDAFNALVRANWVSRGYAWLSDPAMVPELMDPNNTTMYPDGLHPGTPAQPHIAVCNAAAVNTVRNS